MRLVCFAAAAPGLIALGVFAASGLAAMSSGHPLIWAPQPVTLSQAIALKDRGEVVWQLMLGADPNKRYDVAEALRDAEHVMLTPLETAIITREVDLVDTLVDWGAVLDERNGPTLNCLAGAVKAQPQLVERLAERSRPPESCEKVELPWQP
jgi:hypothetical protein